MTEGIHTCALEMGQFSVNLIQSLVYADTFPRNSKEKSQQNQDFTLTRTAL